METKSDKEQGSYLKDLIKKVGLKNFVIIGLCGIALIILSIFPTDSDSVKSNTKVSDDNKLLQGENNGMEYEEMYVKKMEDKLKQTLDKIPNAGPVNVMITLKSSSEKVVLKDNSSSNDESQEEDSKGGTRNSSSSTVSDEVVEFDSENGKVPYVVKNIEPELEGILIITGKDATGKIISDINDAAMALFSLPAHKIKVIKGN